MSNLWDDENEEFRDVPDEAKLDKNGQPIQSPPVQVNVRPPMTVTQNAHDVGLQAPQQEVSYAEGDSELDLFPNGDPDEDDFTEVLNDANLRIEQGRLYQMIMNHDLFEGLDTDPRAISNVQKEIRKFARESMEIMLGMRQLAPAHAQAISPFNSLEVDILKKLASKATNGATESPEANQIAEVVREVPKRKTLNAIVGSTSSKKFSTMTQKQGKLPSRATAPIKRSKLDLTIDQVAAEEGIPRELLEENYVPIGKQLHELTPQELEKREKETMERLSRRKTVKSASSLPMATPEQQEFLAMQRASQMSAAPGMAALLEKVKNMPTKE